jgi:hypothetical protein
MRTLSDTRSARLPCGRAVRVSMAQALRSLAIPAALLLALPGLAGAALFEPGATAFVQFPFSPPPVLSELDTGPISASVTISDGPRSGLGRAFGKYNGPVRVEAHSITDTTVTIGDWVEASASQAAIYNIGMGGLGAGVLVDLEVRLSIGGLMSSGSGGGSSDFQTSLKLRRDGFAGTNTLFAGEKALGGFPVQIGFTSDDFRDASDWVIGGIGVNAVRTIQFQALTDSRISLEQWLFVQTTTRALADFSGTGSFDVTILTPGIEFTVEPAVIPLPPAILLLLGSLPWFARYRRRR